ncbi:RNA-binding S4 domain-containing protein [Erythrobacter oryzae]|uniref:RNA-binding S4 domain-containing protein n=1 Tax=Erythrobacter oryzae TaxID=3019556 RepID=UPI0025532CB9|nr:RNA-binding S4 domain-containing protein [Erythrobacter sp. COR-2]
MTGAQSIRIDRLLVYLRFARTRSAALALIDTHALRRNRKHVLRASEQARIGDVLTIALGSGVRVIELLALPDRRGSPEVAATYYREVDSDALDRKGQMTIGASAPVPGVLSGDPEDFS